MWTVQHKIPGLPDKYKCKRHDCGAIFQVFEQLEHHWTAKHTRDYYRIKRWTGAHVSAFYEYEEE